MQLIEHLASSPEFWTGAGLAVFLILAGVLAVLAWEDDPFEGPNPDWLKSSEELHNEQIRAGAVHDGSNTNWPRHGDRAVRDLQYDTTARQP